MSTFQTPQFIFIPEDARQRAFEFAKLVTETVNYRDSNQSIKEKIKENQIL